MVIWDNSLTRISSTMRELIAARDWLESLRLSPVEAVWSPLKRRISNFAVYGIDHP